MFYGRLCCHIVQTFLAEISSSPCLKQLIFTNSEFIKLKNLLKFFIGMCHKVISYIPKESDREVAGEESAPVGIS